MSFDTLQLFMSSDMSVSVLWIFLVMKPENNDSLEIFT